MLPIGVSTRLWRSQVYLHPSHVRVVAQSSSVLFSRWLTIVLIEMLMIVNGGVSFVADESSERGLTFFGSERLNSILHHEVCTRQAQRLAAIFKWNQLMSY